MLADRRSRRERLRRCREELEREQAVEQAAYDANLTWRAQWEAEHGRKLGGRKPIPPDPDALAKRTINTTDPDTRLMKRAGGRAVQGYNAHRKVLAELAERGLRGKRNAEVSTPWMHTTGSPSPRSSTKLDVPAASKARPLARWRATTSALVIEPAWPGRS